MTRSHGRRAAPTEVANSNANAGEANRTRDAWRVEALPDLRAGLGTPLATEREGSGGKDCAICKEIWIPSEVLSQRNVRHFRQMAPAKWQMMIPPGGQSARLSRKSLTHRQTMMAGRRWEGSFLRFFGTWNLQFRNRQCDPYRRMKGAYNVYNSSAWKMSCQ
jgi:hypothetical protein